MTNKARNNSYTNIPHTEKKICEDGGHHDHCACPVCGPRRRTSAQRNEWATQLRGPSAANPCGLVCV